MVGETLLQDLAYAGRTLRRSPTFAVTVVLTLALGIGANTAIFTMVRAVVLKPLPYLNSQQLFRITGGATDDRFAAIGGAQSFTGVAAFSVFNDNVALSGPGRAGAIEGRASVG